MSLLYALVLGQPQAKSDEQTEQQFSDRDARMELSEHFRQTIENYYLERRSLW